MKHVYLLFFVLTVSYGYSQSLPDYDNIKLEKPSDFKSAENVVLQASEYVLNTPMSDKQEARNKSIQFIIKWMSGTPDYTFSLDGSISKITKKNEGLLAVYMAALSKYCLENPDQAKDNKTVKLNAMSLVLDYCEKPESKVNVTKQIKELIDAKKNGELEKALD